MAMRLCNLIADKYVHSLHHTSEKPRVLVFVNSPHRAQLVCRALQGGRLADLRVLLARLALERLCSGAAAAVTRGATAVECVRVRSRHTASLCIFLESEGNSFAAPIK